jgi:hypothetical protein
MMINFESIWNMNLYSSTQEWRTELTALLSYTRGLYLRVLLAVTILMHFICVQNVLYDSDFEIREIWRSEVLTAVLIKFKSSGILTRYVLIFIDVSKDRSAFLCKAFQSLDWLIVQINCRCLKEGAAGSLSSRSQKPAFPNVIYLKCRRLP